MIDIFDILIARQNDIENIEQNLKIRRNLKDTLTGRQQEERNR